MHAALVNGRQACIEGKDTSCFTFSAKARLVGALIIDQQWFDHSDLAAR